MFKIWRFFNFTMRFHTVDDGICKLFAAESRPKINCPGDNATSVIVLPTIAGTEVSLCVARMRHQIKTFSNPSFWNTTESSTFLHMQKYPRCTLLFGPLQRENRTVSAKVGEMPRFQFGFSMDFIIFYVVQLKSFALTNENIIPNSTQIANNNYTIYPPNNSANSSQSSSVILLFPAILCPSTVHFPKNPR
jgi:hypothetical protein